MKSLNEKRCADIKCSNYFWLERTANSTIDDTVRKVEQHFGLVAKAFCMNELEIKKSAKVPIWLKSLSISLKAFHRKMLKSIFCRCFVYGNLPIGKQYFVAISDGQIVGMTTVMKTDYYPLPEIFPWISSVFVSEDYRGHRISEKLIDFANEYAKTNGFDRTYIPSEHIGLYEKYGYRYLKDIVNYVNGTDRLFVKELK